MRQVSQPSCLLGESGSLPLVVANHWRKVMMTAPDRAEEHQSLRAVLRGIDVDELPWPRHKGRWVYYW
jgi:hypothetical protein